MRSDRRESTLPSASSTVMAVSAFRPVTSSLFTTLACTPRFRAVRWPPTRSSLSSSPLLVTRMATAQSLSPNGTTTTPLCQLAWTTTSTSSSWWTPPGRCEKFWHARLRKFKRLLAVTLLVVSISHTHFISWFKFIRRRNLCSFQFFPPVLLPLFDFSPGIRTLATICFPFGVSGIFLMVPTPLT